MFLVPHCFACCSSLFAKLHVGSWSQQQRMPKQQHWFQRYRVSLAHALQLSTHDMQRKLPSNCLDIRAFAQYVLCRCASTCTHEHTVLSNLPHYPLPSSIFDRISSNQEHSTRVAAYVRAGLSFEALGHFDTAIMRGYQYVLIRSPQTAHSCATCNPFERPRVNGRVTPCKMNEFSTTCNHVRKAQSIPCSLP